MENEELKNRYKLVLVAARRANELIENAPQIEGQAKKKITTIALQDVLAEKVDFKFKPIKPLEEE